MPKSASLISLATLIAFSPAAHSREKPEPLSECVVLPADYEAARFGSQYLLVKDGNNYYRIGFGSSCSAIALSASVKITTDGQPNRLCPRETEVSGRRDYCTVREVVRIDEHEYEVYARKRR